LVHELELATDVRASVGPFHDPGLFEISASAREGQTCEAILSQIDLELERIRKEPVTNEEIERALSRQELGLISGLDTVDGKASTIGFYETVLGEPNAAFARMSALRRVTHSDVLRVARRYLCPEGRTCIFVRCDTLAAEATR
jgi:zinc protease